MAGGGESDGGFQTIFGRRLLGELPNIAHPPYLVVTMADLWPAFESAVAPPGADVAGVHFVETLDLDELGTLLAELPTAASVIGLGGGQALDVAKFVAWRRGLPLFQAPTAMTVNAAFGHRAGLRDRGRVRYLGWAIPEAVYVDYDVIRSAPPALNRSGVGDILCYHTAHRDWRIARDADRCEPQWPYDERLVAAARERLDAVLGGLDEIRDVTDAGIRTLMLAHRWGGAAFHSAGWNPRHIEGVEHFFFYNLEHLTGRHFIHGQPVGLGLYAGSLLQDNDAERMLAALVRVGLDIRPEAMGVTWEDVGAALRTLGGYVRAAGLWFSVADVRAVDEAFVERVRSGVEGAFGRWEAPS